MNIQILYPNLYYLNIVDTMQVEGLISLVDRINIKENLKIILVYKLELTCLFETLETVLPASLMKTLYFTGTPLTVEFMVSLRLFL